MKYVITIVAIGVGFLLISAGTRAFLMTEPTRPQATEQSKTNTFRNAFISGCTSEGVSREDCICLLNEMMQLYPDFMTNTNRHDRILQEGYNERETDAAMRCL
jgi:hypothetical protein